MFEIPNHVEATESEEQLSGVLRSCHDVYFRNTAMKESNRNHEREAAHNAKRMGNVDMADS